nr:hypothetical protein [Tanacetum cinerariifolium]
MVPTKKVDKTPYKLWHGKVPNLSYLKVWGCEAHVKRYTPDKLQQRSVKCIFVGYPKETVGYYFYYPPENKIVVESEHPIEEESLAPVVFQEEDVILVRRSVRTHKAPDRLCLNVKIDPDRLCFNVEVEEHGLGDLNEPSNYKVALSDPEFEKWLVAMNAKMQSMYDNKSGELILIVIPAYYDYEIWKMDVKITFLNGFLEEEIYIEQPEGFIDPNHPRKIPSLQEVKTYLGKCLSIKDLGEAAFILGIKIYKDRSRRLIGLSQNAYLDKILKRYRMDNSKRGSIPMQVDLYLSKSQCATTSAEMKRMQNFPYALAVGSISAKEVVWIRKFIDELGVVPSNDYPIKMNCDNSAAIIMAKESGIQKGARHFRRKYHCVRECIETGEINIVKVHTYDNLADPFMKALAGPKLTRHARSIGLHPASSFM